MQRNPIDPHDDGSQNKRLIVAIALSVLVLYGFHVLFQKPRMEAERLRENARQEAQLDKTVKGDSADRGQDSTFNRTPVSREDAIAQGPRISVENGKIKGSISLTGNRIDDIQLLNYYDTVAKEDYVTLFQPGQTDKPYYAEFSWLAENDSVAVPGKNTRWQVKGGKSRLSPDQPVTLEWNNGQGITFERRFEIDENYLFTVTERIINTTDQPMTFYPYRLLSRKGLPDDYTKIFVLHQGPIGYTGDDLKELSYDDLAKGEKYQSQNGWVGFTDKYWFASIIPNQGDGYKARFIQTDSGNGEKEPGKPMARYQTDVMGDAVTVMPQSDQSSRFHVFAGAKELKVLNNYSKQQGLRNLDLSVDFGIWFFITKPFYLALKTISALFGHVAWGIIILTVLIRLVMFPLNNKSFRSMAAMKKVAPKLKEIQEQHKGDQKVMQQKIMELYQREKVNPFSGCWPILLQIPIFFALYKVIMLDIDMRHAAFPGWIDDMSVMDPTSIFNLFGLLPYDVPTFLVVGAWPCLMGITMFLQRRLNPPPTDPTQARIMAYLPFVFTVFMAKFAVGLIIYWAWSNTLGIIQQYIIMRRMGVDVSLIKGYRGSGENENEDEGKEDKTKEDKTKDGKSS